MSLTMCVCVRVAQTFYYIYCVLLRKANTIQDRPASTVIAALERIHGTATVDTQPYIPKFGDLITNGLIHRFSAKDAAALTIYTTDNVLYIIYI